MDPLEKIMQELDATDVESSPPSTEPKELPHRPIILPPEIKEEIVDNAANPANATTSVPSQITPSDAKIADTTENTPTGAVETSTESNEINGKDDPTANSMEADVSVAEATKIMGTLPDNISTTTKASTQHVPLASEIRVKEENVYEEGEIEEESSESQNENLRSETSNNMHSKEGEITSRIKSEPVDTSESTLTSNIPLVSSNQTSTSSDTDMQTLTKNMLYPELGNQNKGSGNQNMDDTLPDNFFDDLLQDADNITAAALKAAPTNTDYQIIKTEPLDSTNVAEVTQSAPIPDSFFDDLLVDHVAERIEEVVNKDLEVKYSERLKELQELECVEQHSHKAHKKHKKKKKKSHKRSHAEAQEDEESVVNNHKRSKRASPPHGESPALPTLRIRVKSEFIDKTDTPQRNVSLFPHVLAQPLRPGPEPAEIVHLDTEEPETSATAAIRFMQNGLNRIRVKSEFATFRATSAAADVDKGEPDISLNVQEKELFQRRNNNRNRIIIEQTTPLGFKRIKQEKDLEKSSDRAANFLMPKNKMEQAKHRAIAAIEEFKKASKQGHERFFPFIFTTTVRKLPSSNSYHTQQIYENRSPLHNVNNVLYKFNSHANQFNLHEWGLDQMPPVATKVAKILGFNSHALAEKLKTFKLPLKLQKIKKEEMEQLADEKMVQPQKSFLVTVSTQTNDVTVLESADDRRKNSHDIGVQAMPERNNTATQTTGGAATTSSNNYDDLPLMRQIKVLNENQLMALSDFAELIREPALSTDASAMDLYRLRQRMMDIYKCAQLPSELDTLATKSPQPVVTQLPRPVVTQLPRPVMPQHTRDPRIDRMKAIQESPPPPPPSLQRHAHAAPEHPSLHHQLPTASLQIRPSQHMAPHLRGSASSLPAQKIPVISNVQSFHPSAALRPPLDPLTGISKYFGRGGLRR